MQKRATGQMLEIDLNRQVIQFNPINSQQKQKFLNFSCRGYFFKLFIVFAQWFQRSRNSKSK
jgi:hypothetical protein